MKTYKVIVPVRPRSQPSVSTTDKDPNVPAGTIFDSNITKTDDITSSHPIMVQMQSGPWAGKWLPLTYNGVEYVSEISDLPRVVHVIEVFSDGSLRIDGSDYGS